MEFVVLLKDLTLSLETHSPTGISAVGAQKMTQILQCGLLRAISRVLGEGGEGCFAHIHQIRVRNSQGRKVLLSKRKQSEPMYSISELIS